MSADLLLAIDVGTQSVRALVFDREGHLHGRARVPFEPPFGSPQPGWAEKDAGSYWVGLAEACRALKPGGRLLVVDMMPHDREDLIRDMGHVWRGFSEKHIANLFDGAGFAGVRYHPLPADEAAKGPSLFAAVGRRASMPAINADATGDPGSRLVLTA